mmetsp:Transcript_103260/g.296492  ORF Transcript_103260/g.296492 Transcript_103260/m.296492 type:complete len:372 (-) Transcript_103260:221-1336(-)
MRLHRGREHVVLHALVDRDRRVDDRRRELFEVLAKAVLREEARENRRKDAGHGRLRDIGEPHHGKVAEQARRDRVAAAARRGARATEDEVLHELEEKLGRVIEAALVDKLTEELVRRLRTVCLEGRHVEVVNEEHHLFARGRSEEILTLLLELGLHDVFQVRRLGLGAVRHGKRNIVRGTAHVVKESLHDHALADACFAHVKHVEARLHELVEQVSVARRVRGGHQDVEVRHVVVESEAVHERVPRGEDRIGRVHDEAVDIREELRRLGHERCTLVLDPVLEKRPRLVLDVAADRPDHRPDKVHLDEAINVRVRCVEALSRVEQRLEQVEKRLNEVVIVRRHLLLALGAHEFDRILNHALDQADDRVTLVR